MILYWIFYEEKQSCVLLNMFSCMSIECSWIISLYPICFLACSLGVEMHLLGWLLVTQYIFLDKFCMQTLKKKTWILVIWYDQIACNLRIRNHEISATNFTTQAKWYKHLGCDRTLYCATELIILYDIASFFIYIIFQ